MSHLPTEEEIEAQEQQLFSELQELLNAPNRMTQYSDSTSSPSAPGEQPPPPPPPPRALVDEFDEEVDSGDEAASRASSSGPPMYGLSMRQFQQLVVAMKEKPTRKLRKPRVGGTTRHGAWTGLGKNKEGLKPVNYNCNRKFALDDIKSERAISEIEETCKKGLRSDSTLLFCHEHEPNGGKGAMVLQELQQYMANYGMEGVFLIAHADGTTTNMLESPGLVTREGLDEWMKDLLVNGVHNGHGARHKVCPYDLTNLELSAEAILNSCSDTLRADMLARIPAKDKYGPTILYAILEATYRPTLAKMKQLEQQLESLNITKYDGQNVTTFKLEAARLVREIQLNYTSPDPIPDLAIKTLNALKHSTCSDFKTYVVGRLVELHKKPQLAKKADTALKELDDAENQYLTFKLLSLYPPALKPSAEEAKMKAMQAKVTTLEKEVNKLTQDCSASSTKGNSNSTRSNSSGGRSVPSHMKCYTCNGNHYA